MTLGKSSVEKELGMAEFAARMSKVHRSFIREILKVTEDPGIISFAGGLPNPRFFPVREVAEAARKVLDSESGPSVLQYATTEGYPPLRELIAERYARKGVSVNPEQILVLNGSQQGLDLLGKVFLDRGDAVLVERPTYLAAIQSFGMFQPEFHAISLHEDGPDMKELESALAHHKPKFFYSIPNFQNPSGISYSREKRVATARLMASSSAVLVEDDPYGELRFLGQEEPSLRTLVDPSVRPPEDTVVLLGSFSKIVSPGIRLGWISAGREIIEQLVIAKQAADLHSNYLSQRIVHRYLGDNDVDRHIERIRSAYGKQRNLMVELAGKLFPPEVKCTKPQGGMFLWMTLPDGMSSLRLFELAVEQKVAFVPGQAFFTDGSGENTMRLNFSNSDEEKIEEGMKRLARVYARMSGS